MALGDELDGLASAGKLSGDEFDTLISEVQRLNEALRGVNSSVSKDLVNSIRALGKGWGDVATQAERVKQGTVTTEALQNKMAKALATRRRLIEEIVKLRREAATLSGIELTQARTRLRNLAEASAEAGRLAESYQRLSGINQELNRKTAFLDAMEKLTRKIPGLGNLAEDFRNASQSLRQSLVEGKAPVGALIKGFGILGKVIGAVFLAQIFKVDKETTQIANNLNMSKKEAINLKQELALSSLNAEDIAINSERLVKALTQINDQFGLANIYSTETLATYSKLVELTGLTSESAGNLAIASEISALSFQQIMENAAGTTMSMQKGAGVSFKLQNILEETGKVTGQVRSNLGQNPELIARAITQAKIFGAELDDIVGTSRALLDFQSSIENELAAELITGRQLNLERARGLALNGKYEEVAKELTAQAISLSEWNSYNVLQQNELAKAVGMSSDRLSDILLKQEAQVRSAQELETLYGKEALARTQQLDAQQRLSLMTEKFRSIMGDIATIILPIVEGFGAVVEFLSEAKGAVIALTSVMGALAAVAVVNAIASIYTSLGAVPFIGVALASAAAVGLMAYIGQAKQQVADGIAPSDNGPFTITDKYGRMAVTAQGDNIVASPNVNNGKGTQVIQPVVIHNTFSNFQASGPYALAETQRRQASPTFA